MGSEIVQMLFIVLVVVGGLTALFFANRLGRKTIANEKAQSENAPTDAIVRVPCPTCREPVFPDATICPHCRQQIFARDPAQNAAKKLVAFVVTFGILYYAFSLWIDWQTSRTMDQINAQVESQTQNSRLRR